MLKTSFTARLLAIALLSEADDHGMFEWKPLAIEMKAFPLGPALRDREG